MQYLVNERGYFGDFGGAFVPEMLHGNILELRECYREIISSEKFQVRYQGLLRDYVGRPSPLYLAERLSEESGFAVYLKREDLNHTGSHKINNTVGQILLAKELGKTRIIAETGAGQHGVATATVCALMGLQCVVFMGAIDCARQASNVRKMKMLGASVVPVTCGSQTLKDATNEALRDWMANPYDTHYLIGSVVGPHPFPDMVAEFQSVIGREVRDQLQRVTERGRPDAVVACVGGGSNSIGIFREFLRESEVQLFGVEAAGEGVRSGKTAATTAVGQIGVFQGSRTLVIQDGDGQIQEAHSLSAGLDYPGIGPEHAHLYSIGRVKYLQVTDEEAIVAARKLIRLEGIIPALESAHALAALGRLEVGSNANVVLSLSGAGEKDIAHYELGGGV